MRAPMTYHEQRGASLGCLVFRRRGSSVTISPDLPGSPMAPALRALESGDVVGAFGASTLALDMSNGRLSGFEKSLAAFIHYKAGHFDAILPLLHSDLRRGEADADACILIAEWYAQSGCHLAALNMLLRVPTLGWPALSECYRMAATRLESYSRTRVNEVSGYESYRPPGEDSERGLAGDRTDPRLRILQAPWGVPLEEVAHIRGQQLELWNVTQAEQGLASLPVAPAMLDPSDVLFKYQSARRPKGLTGGARQLLLLYSRRSSLRWMPFQWSIARPTREAAVLPLARFKVQSKRKDRRYD